MRHLPTRRVWALATCTLLIGSAAPAKEEAKAEQTDAAQPDAAQQAAPAVSSAPTGIPVYVPPPRARPARTSGGATRGRSDRIPSLWVLVPDHVGHTVSAQPELFWYIDTLPSGDMQLQFTLIDEDAIEPNVQKVIPRPTRPGIHRIRLADYGVKLDVDLEYEWSVALIVDPKDHAKDIVATGWIDRVDSSAQLSQDLTRAGESSAANVYAQNGLWYDAFAATHSRVEKSPRDGTAREAQAKLLDQVGLAAAAAER